MLTFVLGALITAATSIMLGIKLNSLFVVHQGYYDYWLSCSSQTNKYLLLVASDKTYY